MMWEFATTTAEQTRHLARNLATYLQAGDLIVLTGELGAGKTTFTQGLGASLGVRPGIISPTFVLVRIHPNLPAGPNPGGPDLVHVDAYRLGSAAEVDDIDLENTMDTSVTVVEWGAERVEHLAASRLEIELVRATGGRPLPGQTPGGAARPASAPTSSAGETPETAGTFDTAGTFGSGTVDAGTVDADTFDDGDDDEPRLVRLRAIGPRWDGVDLAALAAASDPVE